MQRVAKYMLAEPFRAFRITMASGSIFEIHHPEMVKVGLTKLSIFNYLGEDAEPANEGEHHVSLLSVKSVEPIDVISAAVSPS